MPDGVKIVGIEALSAALKKEIKNLEQEAMREVEKAARVLTLELFKRTPVWTGETVRNYTWSIGTSSSGVLKGALGGSPENTNTLPLGSESNRAINQAAALNDLSTIRLSKLQNMAVTNTIPRQKWDLIDNGSAPTSAGLTPRNPGGVSKIATQAARRRLPNFK